MTAKKRPLPPPRRPESSRARRSPADPDARRAATGHQPPGAGQPNLPSDPGPRLFDPLDPQGLAATYWIDTTTWDGPQSLSVHFSGTRSGQRTGAGTERFDVYEDIDSLPAGTGRIAITTRVSGIAGGSWDVTATPIARRGRSPRRRAVILPGLAPERTIIHTRFHALAQGPGVHVVSWPVLVGLGAVLAVLLQSLFLARQGIDPTGPGWLTVLATAVGGAGARLWSLVLHRQPLKDYFRTGACIQGFLAAALSTLILGSLMFGLPTGRVLDTTASGLFFGMALGRTGCFFSGCCYGRPTASRWGLWSSDRRIGQPRYPVQLYEAFLSLLIGLGTLPFVAAAPPRLPGLVFIGSVTAYTLGRQLLFPLRVQSRTRRGRTLTAAACGLILVADITLAALA